MHPYASRVLHNAQLPYLKPVPLSSSTDVESLPPVVYVRSIGGAGGRGKLTRKEVAQLIMSDSASGLIAVPFIRSISGAAAIRTRQYIFVETVEGHLSGLLTFASVKSRHLFFVGDDREPLPVVTETINQTLFVDPEDMSICTFEPGVVTNSSSDPNRVAHDIARQISRSALPCDSLSEILVDSEWKCFWIDVKPYNWAIDFKRVISHERGLVYGQSGHISSPLVEAVPTSWQPRSHPRSLNKSFIYLRSRPLTCHFITYALTAGLGALYNYP